MDSNKLLAKQAEQYKTEAKEAEQLAEKIEVASATGNNLVQKKLRKSYMSFIRKGSRI
jgi:DNA-binding protein YbaB